MPVPLAKATVWSGAVLVTVTAPVEPLTLIPVLAAKIETTRISSGLDTGETAYADNVHMANILQDQLGYSDMKNHPLQPAIENMHLSNQQLQQMLAALLDKLSQPKTVIRGPDGKIAGVQ